METKPLLRPTLDIVFKLLLGHPDAVEALIDLLNLVLCSEEPITFVSILNPQIPKRNITDKGVILDILAETSDKRLINIEMQMIVHKGLAKRALHYGATTYSKQLRQGQPYTELGPTVVIFLVAHCLPNMLPDDFSLEYGVCQRTKGEVVFPELNDQIRLIFLEIPKGARLWRARQLPENRVKLGQWLAYLDNPASPDLETIIMSNKALKETHTRLQKLSGDRLARDLAWQREKDEHLVATLVEEGKAEGRAEGEAKAKADIIRKLLASPIGISMTDNEIADLAGVSVEMVAGLRQA
jgi:predicted transposase/invertase (TIGR01784 family)